MINFYLSYLFVNLYFIVHYLYILFMMIMFILLIEIDYFTNRGAVHKNLHIFIFNNQVFI